MKMLKNEKGFTLIELVLVVVVLGILASVATVQFGALVSDANNAALDNAPGAYSAQLALTVNTLKRIPTCLEFQVEVFNRVSFSGGKAVPAMGATCGASPGNTTMTFTVNATCVDTWTYTNAVATPGRYSRTATNRAGC
ncbi:MAG: prepilin-type N-terminal cleavage/methylation domain-containing protein [Candidatus Manganitrophaceae bacterium]